MCKSFLRTEYRSIDQTMLWHFIKRFVWGTEMLLSSYNRVQKEIRIQKVINRRYTAGWKWETLLN